MTKLNQNTASLQEILAAINNLPDAGSGGGGAVDTCTVTVSTNVNAAVVYSTTDGDGLLTTAYTNNYEWENTLTVACGSYLYVPINSSIPGHSIAGEAEYIECVGGGIYRTMVFKITANAGETVIINCYDDD